LHERLPIQNAKDELGGWRLRSTNCWSVWTSRSRGSGDSCLMRRTNCARPRQILRGESEVALSRTERPAEEYRESLAVLHAEAQRLTQIVEDLFTLTRADAGSIRCRRRNSTWTNWLRTVRTRHARWRGQANRAHLRSPGELPIRADEALLRRMILNLLDNAIKYTPARGGIAVSCERSGNEYALNVTDSGPGIPEVCSSGCSSAFSARQGEDAL